MKNFSDKKRDIAVLLFLIPFLMGIGVDLYVPSLPIVGNYFQTNNSNVQLTISFYMLGYGIGQVFLGILSDSWGRKKILVMSGALYTIISFLSVFSPNIYILILCRFVQGLGIAGLAVVIRAVAMDCFSPGLELTKAMSYFSISWALGPIVGPFIGSYLQYYFNWQANFYFFGSYGLLIFIYGALMLPETHLNLVPFHCAHICKTIKAILTHPVFMAYSFIGALTYSVMVVFNTVGPFLVQVALRYSAIVYGYLALFLGAGYFLGNLFNRFLINYFSPMKITFFSMIASLLVIIFMVGIAIFYPLSLPAIAISTGLLFFSCGFIMPNAIGKWASIFPKIGGAVSAVSGSIAALVVFLMTFLASFLHVESQMSLALLYVGMQLTCLILLVFCRRAKKHLHT